MHTVVTRTPATRSASLLVLLLLLLVAPPLTGAAHAADDDTDPTAANDSLKFGIGPANFVPEGQFVDGRPYLNYIANPGATVSDSVALINYGDVPLTVEVYATDASTANDGGFSLLAGDVAPTDAGSWITLDLPRSGKVTVPPRTKKEPGTRVVDFKATIPFEATPGDHVGGVVVSLKSLSVNDQGAELTLDQRVGLRTYFRLTGELDPRVEVEDLTATYSDERDPLGRGLISVSYTVHNSGNMRLDVAQDVNVRRLIVSDPAASPPVLQDLLPGGRVRVSQTFEDKFGLGPLEATVTLKPSAVDVTYEEPIAAVTSTKGFWALPWVLIAIIVAVLLVLFILVGRRWTQRRRKQKVEELVSRSESRRSSQPAGAGAAKHRNPASVRGARKASPIARTVAVVLAMLTASAPALLATGSAQAEAPKGSLGEVMLETNDITGVPRLALLKGFWGHEGGKKADDLGTTYISMNAAAKNGGVTPESLAALHEKLQDGGTFDALRVAFVPFSADGSNERPQVKEGDTVADAFTWFGDFGVGTALAGQDIPIDSVATVSTGAEYIKWWDAGRPLQGYDEKLEVIDVDAGTSQPSPTPQGASILNRWPAGEKISMVVYLSDGTDETRPGLPKVAVGEDGRALSSWLTFTTVAKQGDPVRTSAGYEVLTGKGTGPDAPLPPGGLDAAISGGQNPGSSPSAGTPPDATTDTDGDGLPDALETTTATADASDDGSDTPGAGNGDEKSANPVISQVPGGAPVFAIGLVLLVLLAAVAATRWLRSPRSG